MKSTASPSAGTTRDGPLRSQRRQHPLALAGGEPVGEGPGLRRVDRDLARLPGFDDLLEQLPLLGAPELRGAAGHAGGPADRLLAPERLVESTLVAAAQREPLDSLVGTPVEEDVDGAPARGERGGRHDRAEHRILVVFPHRHHPHVDAVLPHQGGQHGLQPLRQPGLLGLRLLAEGAERPSGLGTRRAEANSQRGGEDKVGSFSWLDH